MLATGYAWCSHLHTGWPYLGNIFSVLVWNLNSQLLLVDDWVFWIIDNLYDDASQVSGLKISPLSSINVCSNWLMRCCTIVPWNQYIWHLIDETKSLALHSRKSRLSSLWGFVLCYQVSWKSISRQIRYVGFSCHFPCTSGLCCRGTVNGVSGCFWLRLCEPCLLGSLIT